MRAARRGTGLGAEHGQGTAAPAAAPPLPPEPRGAERGQRREHEPPVPPGPENPVRGEAAAADGVRRPRGPVVSPAADAQDCARHHQPDEAHAGEDQDGAEDVHVTSPSRHLITAVPSSSLGPISPVCGYPSLSVHSAAYPRKHATFPSLAFQRRLSVNPTGSPYGQSPPPSFSP